jgi:riboflavin transporter FmnP
MYWRGDMNETKKMSAIRTLATLDLILMILNGKKIAKARSNE